MDITKPVDKSNDLWTALINDAGAQGVTMERQIVAELEGVYKRLGKLEDRLLHGISEPCQRCADQWSHRPADEPLTADHARRPRSSVEQLRAKSAPDFDLCDCGAQLPRGEPCPNCSAPSPPVYRLEMTGSGEAVVTFTDGKGAGQRSEFCRDLECFVDLTCTHFGGPVLDDQAVVHNALGKVVKDAIAAAREFYSPKRRDAVERRRADLSEIPF